MRQPHTEKRCAVYTRKSTDEGLDSAFNSLDAQYDACSAYVKSQVGMGWRLVERIRNGELPDVSVTKLMTLTGPLWAEQHKAQGIG